NGHYIGHDEPLMTFLSSAPGSGNNINWTETLGTDPSAPPQVSKPGSDVSHYFELTIAPWFGMALCNSESYPELPCAPNSDSNAPSCDSGNCPPGSYPGAGSSFLEMQFYPPGDAPFVDNVSCDNIHWCASLHINDLECTLNFAYCNTGCEEPTNFAFIQRNGVPTGPPAPQDATLATNTPNSETLLMNSGDKLKVHLWDAPVPGGSPGEMALETSIEDVTTGQFGYMQASAKNGFMATSITDCSGTPFDYQPEYNTAARKNIVPWAADQLAVGTQFEIGHFTPCTKVGDPFTLQFAPGFSDVAWTNCQGPYESTAPPDGGSNPEVADALCYPAGDTHGDFRAPPNPIAGCLDDWFQNGDLDFDGSGYWPEWPTSTQAGTYPGSFVQNLPVSLGRQYPGYYIETDSALSENTCTPSTLSGCAIPPPTAPGKFYPYWTRVSTQAGCVLEFGNVSTGNTNGADAQYGTNQAYRLGYPQFESATHSNSTC
ncbi:MAG TPA: hypothetical protein VKT31_02575, partial [Solirubrobacteraceae bacterium]|nr:hypothetical protein [Solirubrobacteraceae bacterium]